MFFLYFFNNNRVMHFLRKDFMKILVCIFCAILSIPQSAKTGVATGIDMHSALVPLIGIRINGGARYTNNSVVEVEIKSLKTADELIAEMQVGTDPELQNDKWQPYTRDKLTITLPAGDGEQYVYARLKDKAGNMSPIENNRIEVDTSPPDNCKIVINKGEAYSNDKLGRVLINAYASGVSSMIISNNPDLQQGQWESYVRSKKWALDISGSGEKTVYARFRDEAGNESETVTASIIFDIVPPEKGEFMINEGSSYTNSRNVMLKLRSQDATRVRIVGNGSGETYDYKADESGWMNIKWQLDSTQGLKNIRAYFMDQAGNRTNTPQEATITYKFRGPDPPLVVINTGAPFTNNPAGKVDLRITPRENPQQLKMVVSNDPELRNAQVQNFSPGINDWLLDAEEDGLKKVHVKLIDEAGNSSEITSSEIILDRTAPVVNRFAINEGNDWTNSIKVSLFSDVLDASFIQISNTENLNPKGPWEKFAKVRIDWPLLPTDGVKTVFARYKDTAGNLSEIVSAKIQLDTRPPIGGIMINDGYPVTNNPERLVQIKIRFEEDAMGMQISNQPDFTKEKLLPVEPIIENWPLMGEDGPKTVFLRLQDKAGNYSQVYTASILLDRLPPTECSLTINNNEKWVPNPNKRVSISLRAEDAKFMMVSNDSKFENAEWMPFRTAIAWTLEGPEGIHYVHAKFKDAAGNESEAITASIQSDFTPPVVNIFSINEGAEYCVDAQKKVVLQIDVDDAVQMAISHAPMRDTTHARALWEPYQATKAWTLEGEDGLKIVYAYFKDVAGNATAEYSTKIILDRMPPSELGISINRGAKWFNNSTAKADIQLHAIGATEMMLSNSSKFTNAVWEQYQVEKNAWELDISGKEATVYAKMRDAAGNLSEVISTSIMVDVDPPRNPGLVIDNGAKYVLDKDRQIKLELKVDDGQYMRISRNDEFRNARWEPFASQKIIILSEPDGEKVFYAQFRDEAGNDSEVISAGIILDTSPPKITTFSIDRGLEWTNNNDKKVLISIMADDAFEMMISDKVSFEGADWKPYTNTIEDFILPGEDGEKNLYLLLRDEAGNISQLAHARINLKRSF